MSTPKLTFISKEKLLEMLENKEDFKLVDVLSADAYQESHLPRAINIPVDQIEAKAPALLPDKSQRVAVYCSSFLCTASSGAARKLQSMGYSSVFDYKGGKKDWTSAGLPLTAE